MKDSPIRLSLFLIITVSCLGFRFPGQSIYESIKTVDASASRETKALYENLRRLAPKHVLVGHQDALAYGVNWKGWHKKRTDMHDVSGQHPALVGWELSRLGASPLNIDSVRFDEIQAWIKQVYKMGGVNTLSWHMDNFVTGGNSWEVGERVVETILPGGVHHEAFKAKLDHFADFVDDLEVGWLRKRKIPIIFRPWHEHTGSWFWWGKDHCTAEEYKALFRFTVEYLRDQKGLHQILYCYSPDVFEDEAHYMERYPGDEYVDILGVDDYHDVGAKNDVEALLNRLRTVVNLAERRDKIAVLSETGYETIPKGDWWTQTILEPIKNDPVASRIAYMMVWRNARLNHHYGPFPGHSSVPDFLRFAEDEFTLFANDLPKLYRL